MSDMYQDYLNNYAETIAEVAENIRENGEPLYRAYADSDELEYYDPIEVVAEIGRPWAVVLACGGPHVELSADGFGAVSLDLYWGGENRSAWDRNGDFETVLDYFTGRDS